MKYNAFDFYLILGFLDYFWKYMDEHNILFVNVKVLVKINITKVFMQMKSKSTFHTLSQTVGVDCTVFARAYFFEAYQCRRRKPV